VRVAGIAGADSRSRIGVIPEPVDLTLRLGEASTTIPSPEHSDRTEGLCAVRPSRSGSRATGR